MQSTFARLFSVPVFLGATLLKGQVLAPVVNIRSVHAPTKKSDNFKICLDVYVPTEGAPSQDDIDWLLPGGANSALKDLHVLLVFKDGTLQAEEASK